jgi:hypothetical protein
MALECFLNLLKFLPMEIHNNPPPKKRQWNPRLTNEMRDLKPGQSVIVDPKTARCIAAYMRYNGAETCIQTISEKSVQIWILE